MTQNLALKYRPSTFSDTVGQKHVTAILRAMLRKNEIPTAILLDGSRGTGKTTTARVLAAALNCTGREDKFARDKIDIGEDPCTSCASCRSIQAGNSLAVLEIDAASNGTVAEIRKINEMVLYDVDALWRVVILDECHSMSKEAFNGLLKTLEEPPERTIFLLLTTEPGKVIETVRSRCMEFEFRRLSTQDLVDRLTHIAVLEGMDPMPEESLLLEIALRAQGGMRDAIMMLDQLSRIGVVDVAGFQNHFSIHNVSPALLEAARDQQLSKGFELIDQHFFHVGEMGTMVTDLIHTVTDLLIVKSGGTPHTNQDLTDLAGSLNISQLVSVIKILWDLKSRTRHVDNDQRAAMEMAFVLLADALSGSARSIPTAAPAKLDLAAMQRRIGVGSGQDPQGNGTAP